MEKRTIAGVEVGVNEEGYLTDRSQWTSDIAVEIAKELELPELTEHHWKVINFLREDYEEKESVATLRRIRKTGGISTKDLYRLFPEGPIKKAAKVAGLPKPESCV